MGNFPARKTSGARLGALGAASALALLGMAPAVAYAAEGQTAEDLTGSLTAESLVEQLIGVGIEYSNVTYTGSDEAAGLVTGMNSIGLSSGIALSSGRVADSDFRISSILGPNTESMNSNSMGAEGDTDLDAIVTPQTTRDASVLEFDFVPTSGTIQFTYVFGSDEYNDWVNSNYNDVFGFFVNGENCAVTDNGDAVSVNTINNDVNAHLYVDNDFGEESPHSTALNGFTVPLTCMANVNANETNHIKLAIADTADSAWDSSVVISSGTFSAIHAPVAEDASYETDNETPIDITLVATDEDNDELT